MSTARPIYETQNDLVAEREIADKLEQRWNCQLRKLPRAYNFDFVAMRASHIGGWVEAKRRNCNLQTYPTVFFSLQKLLRARQLNAASSKPCYFAVQFNDYLAYVNVLKSKGVLGFGGRFDRDDIEDTEPVLLIPSDEFTIISE